MSDLEAKAVEILDKIEAITTNYAPDVAEAALAVVRISAMQDLVTAVIGLVLMVCGFFGFRWAINFCLRKKEEDGYWSDWEIGYMGLSVLAIVLGIAGVFDVVIGFSNVWMWTALFNPELALAHKISGL